MTLLRLKQSITQTTSFQGVVSNIGTCQGLRVFFDMTSNSGDTINLTVTDLTYAQTFTYTPKNLVPALGGIGLEDLGDKTAIAEDHTFSWNQMAIRSIAANNTPVIVTANRNGAVEGSGTTNDSDTKTISIPAGVITRFIEVIVDITALSTAAGSSGASNNGNTSYSIEKEYLATPVDLITTRQFTKTSIVEAQRESDSNAIFTSIYYEPTSDEKTNGFDINVVLNAEATTNADTGTNSNNNNIVVNSIRIMGT